MEPEQAASSGEGRRAADADVARQAFIHSVCSNLGMIAVVLAVNLAIAKRDAITRAWLRVARSRRQAARQEAINRAVSEFRGELDEITHSMGMLDDEP